MNVSFYAGVVIA